MNERQLVVDASVAVKLVVPEHDTPVADAVLRAHRHGLIAPDLMLAECANVIGRAARRRDVEEHEAIGGMEELQSSVLKFHSADMLVSHALQLALVLRHPAYDCFYLALALQLDCRLLTADERFATRAIDYKSHIWLLGDPG